MQERLGSSGHKNAWKALGGKISLDTRLAPNFAKRGGLVVAIAQDVKTKQVLMQAYMNEQAWKETLRTGYATYWSTSRNELWRKGVTSGDWQKVNEIYLDCDSDAVLLIVEQRGKGTCHTGSYSCFFQNVGLCLFYGTLKGSLSSVVGRD